MKKICLIVLVFVLNCTQLLSQSYLKYYKTINNAEMAIIDSLYIEASVEYDSAFASAPKPFAKDYWNALLCAIKLKNNSKSEHFIRKLILKGFDLSHFKKPIFDEFRKSKNWNELLADFENLRKRHKESLDQNLVIQIDSLSFFDQHLRKICGTEKCRDTINKVDNINFKNLFKLIEKHGIIDENDIGINTPNTFLPHYSLFRHYVQSGNQPFIFEILEKAVIEGKFSPSFFTFNFSTDMFGNSVGKNYGINCYNMVDNIKYYNEPTPEISIKINKNRVKIGLDSYEEYIRKIQYSEKNVTDFEFNKLGSGTILEFASEEDKERFLKIYKK